MKLKYPKEVVDFLRGEATIITTEEGNEYMFLPFWFKTTGDENLLEPMSLDGKLPDDLVKAINDQSNPASDNHKVVEMLTPITGHDGLYFRKFSQVKGTNPDGTPNGITYNFMSHPEFDDKKFGPDGGIL